MRWLHISDIHFGYKSASVTTMRKKLLEKAGTLEQVDCLFITGDLRYGKNEQTSYPPETLQFIQDLQKTLKVGPEATFVVPGNHDINRGDGALQVILDAEAKKYSSQIGNISQETLDFITTKRKPFLDLYKRICNREEPSWHYCESIKGFNIICLNTAILSGRDGEDGNLIIGSELLNKLSDAVDSTKPGIVLAHHDFDALRQEEQQKLEIALKDMGAVLYLCGHKHVALSHNQNTYRADKELQVFLCGTNMDVDPVLSQTDMDFFIGQTEDGRSGYVQAYKWYPRSRYWAPDVEFSIPQGGATDGTYYFPKALRPNIKPELRLDVKEQYCKYIRQQCGEIEQNGLPMNEEDVKRRYALRRIFVPLKFDINARKDEARPIESPEHHQKRSREVNQEQISLDKLIPSQGCIRMFVLSDPGGGKTTLLKWIASVYCFPSEYEDNEAHLPRRTFFPVWLRCRDIPEGSRPTIWNTIQNIALRGEWLPHGSDAADFTALVAHHIAEGTMLLLIDGLDEIGVDADRENFVEQLRIFSDLYPDVSIIVSSRPTGFSLVTKGMFPDFECVEISSLNEDDILELCIKWNTIIQGESEKSTLNAHKLAERIASNERIFRLASNPLLLTTLLLVERRVGRLPTKRVELYEQAIQVLLETWNRRGHERHHIDLDEARYLLSYVAFYMTTNQKNRTTQNAQITRSELLKLLKKAQKELAELISDTEKPSEFIKNIEYRSALLIQKGYVQNKNGEREALYEFQHLTFQEYLAAYAINHDCYPGAKEGDDPISVITPYLVDKKMREVIPLVAVRLPRYIPRKLVDVIMDKLKSDEVSSVDWLHLRELLLQLVADEVMLPEEKINQIMTTCFEHSLWDSDGEILCQILEGKNSQMLRKRFEEMDAEQNGGYDEYSSALAVLSGEIADPYQYYKDNCSEKTECKKIRAIAALCAACFWEKIKPIEQFGTYECNALKKELVEFAKESNPYVRKMALTALQDTELMRSGAEASEYINLLAYHVNACEQIPDVIPFFLLLDDCELTNIKSLAMLSESALHTITTKIETREPIVEYEYCELLALGFFSLICSEKHDVRPLLFALTKQRQSLLRKNPSNNNILHLYDEYFAQALRATILDGDQYGDNKQIIQEYILKTDMAWAKEMKSSGSAVISYTDYSCTPADKLFELDGIGGIDIPPGAKMHDILDEIIEHIDFRLKELN